jgi:NADH-quinone oxidoreductase subunit J
MEEFLSNLPALLFWIIATLTALCAVAVVVSQNIVRSATWLLFTLGGTSAIFFLLGADFVGATQLLVYVGGTLVLVVFGVMLTAQGPFISMKASVAEWATSAVVGLLLFAVLAISVLTAGIPNPTGTAAAYAPVQPLSGDPRPRPITSDGKKSKVFPDDKAAEKSQYAAAIGLGFVGVGVGPAHHENGQAAARVVRTNYLLPFEIVSVHLLVVLIGAAYLARAKRRAVRPKVDS